jgi:hypothetical protein
MSRDTRETRNLLYPLDPSHMYGSQRSVKQDPMFFHGTTNDRRKNEFNFVFAVLRERRARVPSL